MYENIEMFINYATLFNEENRFNNKYARFLWFKLKTMHVFYLIIKLLFEFIKSLANIMNKKGSYDKTFSSYQQMVTFQLQ